MLTLAETHAPATVQQRAATTGQHGAAVPAPAASAVASATTKTAGRGSGMAAVGNAAAGMEPAGMASMAASGAAAAAAAATGTAEAAAAGMMEVGKAAAGTEPAGMASMAAAGAAAAGTAATAYTGGAHAFAAGVAAASPAAAGTAAAAAGKASSLYDRLGGETLVLDTVEILYKKVGVLVPLHFLRFSFGRSHSSSSTSDCSRGKASANRIPTVLVSPAHNAILTIPLSPILATQLWQIKCSVLNERGCCVLISTAHNAVLTFPLFPTSAICTAAGIPVAVALLLPHQPLCSEAAPGGLRVREGKRGCWNGRSPPAIACLPDPQ